MVNRSRAYSVAPATRSAFSGSRGSVYDVVREQQELDLEAPAGAPYFRDIRLTSRDVILAKRGQVTVHDVSSANFVAAQRSRVPSGRSKSRRPGLQPT